MCVSVIWMCQKLCICIQKAERIEMFTLHIQQMRKHEEAEFGVNTEESGWWLMKQGSDTTFPCSVLRV